MVLLGQSNGPHTICARAQGILESFANNVVTIVDCNLNSNRHECVRWEPPPVDWLKLNVDATINANKGVVGYGLLCATMMVW